MFSRTPLLSLVSALPRMQAPGRAIAQEVHARGFAIVRGALPAARVQAYREGLELVYQEHARAPARFAGFPLGENVAQGDVTPAILRALTGLELAALYEHQGVDQAVRALLGPRVEHQSTLMRVGPGANATVGIRLHTDGIIQGSRELVVALWTPFEPCGELAPGLALVSASRAAVTDYLRERFPGRAIPGWHSSSEWNSTGAFELEAIERAFGPVHRPHMLPGDVAIFTNWTVHGSNYTPGMTRPRSAAVVRYKRLTLRDALSKLRRRLVHHA